MDTIPTAISSTCRDTISTPAQAQFHLHLGKGPGSETQAGLMYWPDGSTSEQQMAQSHQYILGIRLFDKRGERLRIGYKTRDSTAMLRVLGKDFLNTGHGSNRKGQAAFDLLPKYNGIPYALAYIDAAKFHESESQCGTSVSTPVLKQLRRHAEFTKGRHAFKVAENGDTATPTRQ